MDREGHRITMIRIRMCYFCSFGPPYHIKRLGGSEKEEAKIRLPNRSKMSQKLPSI